MPNQRRNLWNCASVLVTVLVTLCCLCQGATAQTVGIKSEQIDLFIFAGQSNMVGFDADPEYLGDEKVDRRVWFWWGVGDPPSDEHDSTSGNEWLPLQPQSRGNPITPRNNQTRQYGNFANVGGGFGPEFGFVRTYMDALDRGRTRSPRETPRELPQETNDLNPNLAAQRPELAVLKVAYNGTSLRNDWDPEYRDDDGNCFGRLIREFEEASRLATERNVELTPAAFFWVQGESDANPEDSPHYASRLRKMILSIRQELREPDLPFLLAINTRFLGPNNPEVGNIVEAQKSVASEDRRIHYVDTSKASVLNSVHFDAAGTL